ncbi:MAG: sigma-E processing peptidase SpoIIGA [Clostridiales bacterium]|jgi:stage II sporulation protein GA (sporulation sigma-E factor processing peptidase)|nr:sigma-E processing peptidase SpoIIGA [Clostridiales bacterium]
MGVEYRYIDVLFIDNLTMNFVILRIAHRLSKNGSNVWRQWLAAGIGALYAVLIVLPELQILQKLPMKLALSLIMILTAYKLNTFKELFKIFTVFYIVTFIFGGVALSLYFINHEFVDISNGAFVIKSYPAKNLVMTCILAGMLIRSLVQFIRLRLSKDELLYKVEILFEEKRIVANALLDTGNTLSDPISHYPVLVIEFHRIRDVLPPEIKAIFDESREDDLEAVMRAISQSSWMARFRMIPFSALGKTNGMLIGFKPDAVDVLINGNWKRISDIVVAVYNNRLSKDKHYQALINPEMVA